MSREEGFCCGGTRGNDGGLRCRLVVAREMIVVRRGEGGRGGCEGGGS